MRKHYIAAEIISKVVSVRMTNFAKREDGTVDDARIAEFEVFFFKAVESHTRCRSILTRPALGEYHFEFASSEGDQVLTDFVNKCRRTAMRRLHGNKNRKEREAAGAK